PLLRRPHTPSVHVFMLCSDCQRRVDEILADAESAAPDTQLCDEYCVILRLWIVARPDSVAEIQKAMQDQMLVIADGHHRYETALAYRSERRAHAGKIEPHAPFERVMMTFINTQSEG